MNKNKQQSPSTKKTNRPNEVPVEILEQLNSGIRESANLAEMLAIDFATLISYVIPEISNDANKYFKSSDGITKRMLIAGELLSKNLGATNLDSIAKHPADTVRSWAAYAIASIPDITLSERLNLIQPLADDNHFNVREWAWLALRPHITVNIQNAIELMAPWVEESSPNIRRFAIESTRPRGVWCPHIQELKKNPQIGLPLLEPVKADTSRYVQDSVGNWLNDAAKQQPDWVLSICKRWQVESNTKQTTRICSRALRNLKKYKAT
ncbi:DNA alkylation repair protein [Dulcicalothrix desertica]|nr:DNA alkylation repair protein [Dulcicalothrix desertica]